MMAMVKLVDGSVSSSAGGVRFGVCGLAGGRRERVREHNDV